MNPDLKIIYLGSLIDKYIRSFSDMSKEMEKINQCININEYIENMNLLNDDILLNINSVKEQLLMYK
jgi:hypothetical protein